MTFFKSFFGNSSPKINLVELFESWLTKININSGPGEEIISLNFGIFESDKGYAVYLIGSKEYDSENDDWATKIDFNPPQNIKYFIIPMSLTKNLNWEDVQNLVVSSLKIILGQNKSFKLFKDRIVTTGFDDGKLVRLA